MNLISVLFVALYINLTPAVWLTDFDQAKNEAATNQKYILLNFSGSDWCTPCIKMKKTIFLSEEFENYANENLILLHADFPRLSKNKLDDKQTAHNEKLAELYNSKGTFPLTLLLDAEGNVIKKWEGLPALTPAEFVTEITNAVNAAKK
ncbi:MAG: thiol-disulfide isomerase [Bacteroidetes bacterium GWF2_38_335]|nr:MAG: thiol-disulfide isomerase [Bacteroidetes bacterium GWF2_38_335]OFY79937.1 MAG: thiol-disulfide isomerase [Bacteroidetes bacterium RIFOXYA12_FULL_38_20]HBS86395.1 thiol-disulfide isomerase [Bacteroidales bacterium]